MKVQLIDSKNLPIIEYRHIHDAKISFRKYRENFNFGLTINQYYFAKTPKDKKTNFNTQYTLTDTYPLSTIAELNIPFTTNAVSAFTTTIKQNGKYLKNDYTDLSVQSIFVDSTQFNTLSSEFFFTFTLSSIKTMNDTYLNRNDLISISQQHNSITYYLSAPTIQGTTALWTSAGPSYFNYILDDNKKLTIHNKSAANILINEIVSTELDNGNFSATTSGTYADPEHWTAEGHVGWEYGDDAVDGGLNEIGGNVCSGWTWDNGYANHVVNSLNATGSADNMYQDVNTILGRMYEVTFTISNYSDGNIRVYLGTSDPTPPWYKAGLTGDGVHTVLVDADLNTPSRLFIQASHDFIGRIDNVSIAGTSLYWRAPGAWQDTVSDLSKGVFDVNRNLLTKDFKTLPNTFNKYKSNYNTDTVSINTATAVNNNYFVYNNNYNFLQNNNENKFVAHVDFFPLKNQATLHEYYSENNHYNYEANTSNRIYEKINAGTHQQHGYDKIGLSYNIGTYDIHFKPNKLTYFTTPNSMSPYTVLNINDSKIENLGAIPGNNPLMSDKVFKRREILKNNNFSDDINPMYLCSWLSGSSDGDTKWVDRYYNPLASNFSEAMSGTSHYKVITAAGAQTTETFDISSSLTFEPNNDYGYYHVGDHDYENLFKAFDSKYNTTKKAEYLTYKGIPLPVALVKKDRELNLDGNAFARNNTDIQGDFSLNFWLHTKNNDEPFCYKILGNYFEDGIGVFNTDLVTPNIILPVVNITDKGAVGKKYASKLLFLNNDLEVYDYIILKEGNQEVTIDGIARKDNFSEFYVLGYTMDYTYNTSGEVIQSRRQYIIYVFNNNNHLISKIEDLKNSNIKIDDFEVDENKLHVLFNPISDQKYFTYDIKNNTSSVNTSNPWKATPGKKGKIIRKNDMPYLFEVDSNGHGNEVAFDSNNVPWIIKQDNPTDPGNTRNHLRKGRGTDDKNKVLSGLDKRSKINGVLVDDDDNIIVLHDENTISILDNDRKLIRTREFCNILNTSKDQTYIDLIYDFEKGVYKKYILLIQEYSKSRGLASANMVHGTRLTKIDHKTLKIISSKKLAKVDVANLRLTKTVTSFSYLKKIGANKNRLKVVLKKKPKFSTSGVHYNDKSIIDFDFSKLNGGYNHFFINVSLSTGFMSLFINGKLVEKVKFAGGKYALTNILETGIYVGAVSTPFYLTLANKLLQPKKYFVHNAKIKGFKIYNKVMNYFDILAHYNYHIDDKDVVWSYPLGQRTYIDTIDKLIKFNYPEKLSNKYNVNINHTDISDDKLKKKIHERVEFELKKIAPYFDEAKNISIS